MLFSALFYYFKPYLDDLKPIFDDEIIDSIILQEAKDHQDVTIRPHPHEFSLYADV